MFRAQVWNGHRWVDGSLWGTIRGAWTDAAGLSAVSGRKVRVVREQSLIDKLDAVILDGDFSKPPPQEITFPSRKQRSAARATPALGCVLL